MVDLFLRKGSRDIASGLFAAILIAQLVPYTGAGVGLMLWLLSYQSVIP